VKTWTDWQEDVEPDYPRWAAQHGREVVGVLTGPPHLLAVWTDDNLVYHARQAARYGLEALGQVEGE